MHYFVDHALLFSQWQQSGHFIKLAIHSSLVQVKANITASCIPHCVHVLRCIILSLMFQTSLSKSLSSAQRIVVWCARWCHAFLAAKSGYGILVRPQFLFGPKPTCKKSTQFRQRDCVRRLVSSRVLYACKMQSEIPMPQPIKLLFKQLLDTSADSDIQRCLASPACHTRTSKGASQ